MISIVLVSHSRKLAEGLMELLGQVAPPEVRIAEAAGVGPDLAEIGTDAVHIAEVIQVVDTPDGVLVLMDLGSAVLSAEVALDLLPEEMRERVCVCPAPFVEGALTAGVQAGLGNDLQTICRESQKALEAKIAQVSPPAGSATVPVAADSAAPTAETYEQRVPVGNPHGLHLRPAAQFVQAAAHFQAEISVWNLSSNSGPASAKSINALAMLNVQQGDEICIAASGPEAEDAVRMLSEMIRQNFGERSGEAPGGEAPGMGEAPAVKEAAVLPDRDEKPLPLQDTGPGAWSGIPISSGVAIAPLYRLKREIVAVEQPQTEDAETEWKRLEQVLQRVKANLQKRQTAFEQRLGKDNAPGSGAPESGVPAFNVGILDAQRLLLEDPELIEPVRRRIFQEGASAASAWSAEIKLLKERYLGLADPYLKQRAADIVDAGSQVLAELAGKAAALEIPGSTPVILYAEELSPTETAQLDLVQVSGFVTTSGAGTSHSAILARALGIPAVSGIDRSFNDIPDGTLLVLDGDQGLVWVDPPAEVRTRYAARKRSWAAEQANRVADSQKAARLKNGRRIEVLANIGSLEEAKLAAAQGADGVGLLRTEFLFLSRAQAPVEDEQVAALFAIGQAMEGRPVIVRTLDVGGDKDLPYLSTPAESNPFLGVRAVRLALQHPDIFQTQLRAILRAAGEYPFRIMFPMIANMRDLQQALEQLETAHTALFAEHVPHRWPIETGIMVEIPSAALLSDRFAPKVDFFSIGTNDLTQYTLAADRGNPALAEYNDAMHPAVLNLIQQVVRNGKRFGKRVGICGELAGDPLAAAVLVGLGLEEFSLNPAAIPTAKNTIRMITEDSAARLAERVLQMDSAANVRAEAQKYLQAVSYGK